MRARHVVVPITLLAGTLLAACGATPVKPPATLDATPSINISVPLAIGGCDGAGTCYAFGTTDASVPPTDAGQMIVRAGAWTVLPTPPAPNAELSIMSCWYGGCLVFGVDSSGNFAWRVHDSSVVAARVPTVAGSVVAASCFASATCGLVTTDAAGTDQYWRTNDGGMSWSAPATVVSVASDHLLALACSGPAVCVATGSSPGGALTVTSTDAGARWGAPVVSSTWRGIDDLFCSPATCVALADSSSGDSEIEADALGVGWTAVDRQPGGSTNTLSCGTTSRCVATTESLTANPGLDIGTSTSWKPLGTLYLPNGITSVGCSATRCVVVDDTSVATLSP